MEIQIFKSSELTGKYGPGHNFFTVDQNDNPVFGIPGYEIRGNKDVTLKIIIE